MIRKSTNDLSIRPKMSRSTLMVIVIGSALAVFALMYWAHGMGVRSGHQQFDADQAKLEELQETVAKLKAEQAKTQESLVFSQRQAQIQEEAYAQMSKAYSNSEQKNAVLGSRLDFYRSIISPESGQSGPAIQALNHQVNGKTVNFDVTLVQAIKHKHQIRGNLTVSLFQNDQPVSRWPANSTRSVNYQYFQQVSGSFENVTVADGSKIKVELDLQGGETLERWFDVAKPAVAALENN